MKVTIDRYRILHLILLIICSFILAEILIKKLGWSRLSAYGFACTLTSQISQAIHRLQTDNPDGEDEDRQDKRERVIQKRRDRRTGESGVRGKKKR
ncbi:hypothetical protein ACHAWF_002347 [Thalassiosira exigua]